METTCTYVASEAGFGQAVMLGVLMIGAGVLASKRARDLIVELAGEESSPLPEPSPANT